MGNKEVRVRGESCSSMRKLGDCLGELEDDLPLPHNQKCESASNAGQIALR